MNNSNNETFEFKNINIRLLILSMILVAIILSIIYFIKIYSSKKHNLIHNLRVEAQTLDNIFSDEINYSIYFANLLIQEIKSTKGHLKEIDNILHNYSQSLSSANLRFGWRKYSWVDNNFREIITSTKGIEASPKYLEYLKDITLEPDFKNNNVNFFTSIRLHKNNSLKLIIKLSNSTCQGYLILSYDLAILNRQLNQRKKHLNTNFLIIDKSLKSVVQSKPVITDFISTRNKYSEHPYLGKLLKQINFKKKQFKEISYVDMRSGINYYIKKISNFPYAVIVNINHEEIQYKIIEDIIKKFLEIAAFASIFLIIVVSIYRRESWLREKAEKATLVSKKATKDKSDFLAFAAHEIRSPLGFILTGSEIAQKELLGPLPLVYKEYIDGIHFNSKLILEFITDILDETQIVARNFKITEGIEDLDQIIQQSIKICKTRYHNRKISLNIEKIEAVNFPKLICDKRRMLQVINNLITNSIKYSQDNTVVSIILELQHNQLILKIIDQGAGMSENELAEIIQNLNTNVPQYKKNLKSIESYGLGLPIVKMLVEAHDAKLAITSSLNIGTTVTISFPQHRLIY